jgi:hypothetical protein
MTSYLINGVEYQMSILNTFKLNGVDITFKNYYLQRYGIELTNETQPLLTHKDKYGRKIYLIPELCYITHVHKDLLTNNEIRNEKPSADKVLCETICLLSNIQTTQKQEKKLASNMV